MAGKDRRTPAALKADLLQEAPRYAFFQLLRTLFRLLRGQGTPEEALWQRVQVRPDLTLAFTGGDVAGLEELSGTAGESGAEDPDARYRLTVAFLGLYGSSSPLPTFYTEDLMEEWSEGRSGAREFLDLLNASLYPLHYRSWARHRLLQELVENPRGRMMECLLCLGGLGGPASEALRLDPHGLLGNLGLLGMPSASAEGLRAMICAQTGLEGVHIEPCVERSVQVPAGQHLRLGSASCVLGVDAHLGSCAVDRMGKFRLELGPLDAPTLASFLPGRPAFQDLAALVELQTRGCLAWDLELSLGPGQWPCSRLGAREWGCLGMDTWVVHPACKEGLSPRVRFHEPVAA